jgi:hypothetical protein
MKYRHIACAAALVGAAMAAVPAACAGEPRAVIELFTSQGCSSCPPADRLMGELARDPSLVVLSLPVDYWDYLGWKDTLALRDNTSRQRAYSVARGDRDVYTPQVVVNGLVHVLGSDKAAIERAIDETRQSASPLSLHVTVHVADGMVTVKVPATEDQTGRGEVWLCPVTTNVPVKIERGENTGHTLIYHDVVRRWVKLGDWSGKAETFTLPLSKLPDANVALEDIDGLAVILQGGAAAPSDQVPSQLPGLMLGAATASLR